MGDFQQLWVYLSTTPLLWLTLTLAVFQISEWLFRKSKASPFCNPVLLSILMLVGLLMAGGVSYQTYFSGAQFLQFLLGPATVALAVPLYRQLETIRRNFAALAVTLVAGSLIAMGTSVGIAWLLGAGPQLLLTLAPKSVTSPIAMGIAEKIGGIPSLAAVTVILTGITGAALGGWVLDRARITDDTARGIAIGLVSHGIGTARAMMTSQTAGAFAGLAMGLNGLLTALLLPVLVSFWK